MQLFVSHMGYLFIIVAAVLFVAGLAFVIDVVKDWAKGVIDAITD